MQTALPEAPFIDRRAEGTAIPPERERRQFTNSFSGLSPEATEVAEAIDQYKVRHRRRFITYEEMLSVFRQLGYHR
jgi:NTP pyrophosphatase (non-canonical NTP hydrolase)